jgi:hypothetical protein
MSRPSSEDDTGNARVKKKSGRIGVGDVRPVCYSRQQGATMAEIRNTADDIDDINRRTRGRKTRPATISSSHTDIFDK